MMIDQGYVPARKSQVIYKDSTNACLSLDTNSRTE